MNRFTLYELSIMTNAIERQRQSVITEYTDKMKALEGISRKLRVHIDALQRKTTEELEERGFFDDYSKECFDDE